MLLAADISTLRLRGLGAVTSYGSGDFSNVVFTNWSCPIGDTCTDDLESGTLTLDISGSNGSTTPKPEPNSSLSLAIGLAGPSSSWVLLEPLFVILLPLQCGISEFLSIEVGP